MNLLIKNRPATPEQRGRRGWSNAHILVSATEPERFMFAHALRAAGRVTFVSGRELGQAVDELEPELVIISIKGSADGLRAVDLLLGDELSGRCVIAVHDSNPDLGRVLGRIAVYSCVVRPRDLSALRDGVRAWLSGRLPRHRPRLDARPEAERGNSATANLVASMVREADNSLSAHDVATRCGFSVVTSRRYLQQLVTEGLATVDVHRRSVGRPINLYRWAG